MKILIIDDNVRLTERINEKLRKHFNFDTVFCASDGLESLEQHTYDVIVLDIGLPDMNGLELCRLIRNKGIRTPILVLTGYKAVDSKVKLLEAGADDYLVKPFEIHELRVRLLALSRRQARNERHDIVTYKDITIDTERHTVTRAGVDVKLRRKEFDILHYLLRNNGRIMTREMIIAHAWNNRTGTWVNTVDVHIKHLRDKIDRPFNEQYIKTCYGLGYKVDAA